MRDRVTILVPATTRDASGDAVPSFADGSTVWAAVEPEESGEVWRADRAEQTSSVKVTMRYRAGLTTRHRLRVNGRDVYAIDSVTNPDGRRRETVCRCRGV
jgi:SPP1 family predicted phage head-tail adaptor